MPIGWAGAHKKLEDKMLDEWDSELADLLMENSPYKPHDEFPFMRFFVLEGDSMQSDLMRRNRHAGLIEVQVFTTALKGVLQNKMLCDKVAAIWRQRNVGTEAPYIITKVPSINRVGDALNGYYQFNVSVPFYWDESY